ncbi:peptidoglycan recognition protein [Streptomyces sp. E11-3]|uniref:peptidoglycan recognition protein family protein n=1 Tax=Streptomyces sp. E11-3 TaxID=3110112 RepID=UPI00397EE1B5
MRGFLASSIGVTCAAALCLPLALPAGAQAAAARGAAPVSEISAGVDDAVAGATQSLRLGPLGTDRALGGGAARHQGIAPRDVRPFSLVGVVWDDADAELHGRVQVRTRAADTTTWSDWQDVETHNSEHAADPGSAERDAGERRGATAPLWVGDSDGVEVRVRAEDAVGESVGESDRAAGHPAGHAARLPDGLRLELVDPGAGTVPENALADDPQAQGAPADTAGVLTAETAASSAVNAQLAPLGASVIPERTKKQTEADLADARGEVAQKPYIGPRPRIITRKGWGANERLRERSFLYTRTVKAAFVHHSATGNNYTCAQAPSVLRAIYRYHVVSSGWRDFGYNFAVDKCGNIYEGRAGGVTKPVMGAHTLGFNRNSTGIAVLGTFTSKKPSASAVNAVAKLTAWKLGLYGRNPKGKTYLTSGGSNLHKKGKNVRLNVISGHRDGFATECPGRRLYGKLGTARSTSARLQGR